MANNAKQYTDLNKTTKLNASDLVAVAQNDKTELQATTVNDLASAIGELNSTGALAELSLATSIGKNLLAQRLNEKGVENIRPNSTLVEMADAINDLVVQDSTKFYTGYASDIKSAREFGVIGDITVSQVFSIAILPKGKRLIFLDGSLYAIPDGTYTTIKDALDHAVAVSEIQHKDEWTTYFNTKSSYDGVGIGFSNDGNTASIVYDYDSSTQIMSADMYDINWESKTISFLKSITWKISSYADYTSETIAISNDRKYIIGTYYSNSTLVFKNVDTNVQNTVNVPRSSNASTKSYFFDPNNEENTFYVVALGYLYKSGFSDSGTAITLNNLAQVYTTANVSVPGYYAYDINKWVGVEFIASDRKLRLWIYDLSGENPTYFDIEYTYTYLANTKQSYPYYDSSASWPGTQHAFYFARFKKNSTQNKWYILAPTLELSKIYYDADSNTIGTDDIKFLGGCTNYWYFNYPNWSFAILLNLTNNNYITCTESSGYTVTSVCYSGRSSFLYNTSSSYSAPTSIGCEHTIDKQCVFVGKFTNGIGTLKYQYAPYLNRPDLLAGAYDLTTKQVEIPTDGEATK